jgi:hypothetical protein
MKQARSPARMPGFSRFQLHCSKSLAVAFDGARIRRF